MAEFVLWQATNGLLFIPIWIALVMVTRRLRGRPAFTKRDWLFPTGYPRGEIISLHFWLRLAALWFTTVLIGVAEICGLLPFGLALFLSGMFLAVLAVLLFAPKWG
jgi:hypothetical protein